MNYLINQAMQAHRENRSLRKWAQLMMLPALMAAIAACASVPHTGRRQFNMISDSQLNALAIKAFNEVCDKEPQSKDERLTSVVNRVTQRISQAAESLDKPGFKWDVRLIEKEDPNAFCLPGGKIVVSKGIVPYARNESGLAAILAHEVAHATARHGGERLSQKALLDGAVAVGSEVIKDKDGTVSGRGRLILSALGLGGVVGVILPYSRVHEFEADRIGQLYMAKAGYDPEESVRVWDRLSRIKKPPVPVWLSTHPSDQDRVRKLKEFLPDARKLYEDTPTKYGHGSLL